MLKTKLLKSHLATISLVSLVIIALVSCKKEHVMTEVVGDVPSTEEGSVDSSNVVVINEFGQRTIRGYVVDENGVHDDENEYSDSQDEGTNQTRLSGNYIVDRVLEQSTKGYSDLTYSEDIDMEIDTDGHLAITSYDFLADLSGGGVLLSNMDGYNKANVENPEFYKSGYDNDVLYRSFKASLVYNTRDGSDSQNVEYGIGVRGDSIYIINIHRIGGRKMFQLLVRKKS